MTDKVGAANTDRELWRGESGLPADGDNYYAPSIHVTAQSGVGIKVGGRVVVKSLREWHSLAMQSASPRVGTGFNTQAQAEAAALQSASPRPTGDVVTKLEGILDAIAEGELFAEDFPRELRDRLAATLQPADPVEPKVSSDVEELIARLRDFGPKLRQWMPDVWTDDVLSAADELATLRATDPSRELVEAKAAYHELLYAVAQAYDGETRHQTALRYITEREAGNGDQRAALATTTDEVTK